MTVILELTVLMNGDQSTKTPMILTLAGCLVGIKTVTLQERHGISNDLQLDCLFNNFFRLTTKIVSQTFVVTGWFPSQRASNAESVSTSSCDRFDLAEKSSHTYHIQTFIIRKNPDSKIYGANMGPKWGPPGADRTQVGPMLAPWTLLSGKLQLHISQTQ